MAKPIHHAYNSQRKFGGNLKDHWKIHHLMDTSKSAWPKVNHRAVFHHDFGIDLVLRILLKKKKISCDYLSGETIAFEHVIEDLGFVPTLDDWNKYFTDHPLLKKRRELPACVHADITAMKFGGKKEDYLFVHEEMNKVIDETQKMGCVIYHSAFGCFIIEQLFGDWIIHNNKVISIREIAELHILREYDTIPTLQDWLSPTKIEPWMAGSRNLLKMID